MIQEQQKIEVSIKLLEQFSQSNFSNPIRLVDASNKLKISLYYAENIIKQLRRHKLVTTFKVNNQWHYQTTKELNKINIQEINEVFSNQNPNKESMITPLLNKLLSKTTISDVLNMNNSL